MSWLENKISESEGFNFGVPGYEALYSKRIPVKNDNRFLFKSEAQCQNLPSGEKLKLYAVWIDRSQKHAQYLGLSHHSKKHLYYSDPPVWPWKEESNVPGTYDVVRFGRTSIIRFNGREEKWDCIVTPGIEKMDSALNLLYGIKNPSIKNTLSPRFQDLTSSLIKSSVI